MYYDKRIRYLSYYESDIKLQNAGYVKFQVRDSLCQMIVYVKGPRLMGSGEAAVYLLSRKQGQTEGDGFFMGRKDSRLQKHLLGNLNIYNGQGHCAVRMNAENMADSGLRYDEICGIRLELHEYQYLESQWSVVNFMPERQRADNSENAGYRLREPQGGRRVEEERRGAVGSSNGRRWQRPLSAMREEWPGERKDSGEKASVEEEPVKVDLIVTPVSENLRVEKLVKEELLQEEMREAETWVELPERAEQEEAENVLTEVEDSMQGMLEREVRREEARSGGRMPSVQTEQVMPSAGSVQEEQAEQTGKVMSSARDAQEEQAEQIEQTGQVISSARDVQEEQAEQTEQTGQVMPSAGSVQEERTEQTRQPELQTESRQKEKVPGLRQGGREEQAEQLPGMETLQEAVDLDPGPEMQLSEQELQTDKWEQLRKTFPVVHPIREEEEYLKIAPKDFVIFTEKYQELVHNSFLLHGYYNYKHLILGKKEKEGRVIYYLGVPGTFHEREKTVAVMFGFEAFDGRREPAENGDFGYYLRRVEI